MLVVRALLFTILVPGVVAIYIPWTILDGSPPIVGEFRFIGLVPIAAGALGYFLCALEFMQRGGGTPTIFFTRPLRFLIGEEPKTLVQSALYRHTRNPMYVSVTTVVLGEAILFESRALLYYACALWLIFHLVVVLIEEPHLRKRTGYIDYCARVPRWLIPSVRK